MEHHHQPQPKQRPNRSLRPHHRSKPGARQLRLVRNELSAGGAVARQEHNQWFIALLKTEHKRGEVWVLPKGHVELKQGETVSEAARREVQEEAGLSDISVKDELGVTRYAFQAEGALVRKKVHYFLMVTQQKQLTPQAEEAIVAAEWMPIDKAIEALEYETDKEIVRKARQRLLGTKGAPTQPLPRRSQPSRTRKIRVHT